MVVDLDHPDQDLSEQLALDPSKLYATSNQPSHYLVVARENLGTLPQSIATQQMIQPQRVGLSQGTGGILLGFGMLSNKNAVDEIEALSGTASGRMTPEREELGRLLEQQAMQRTDHGSLREEYAESEKA